MKSAHQRLIAFALETNEEQHNAQRKLLQKNADFIVMNSTRNPGTTFQSDDNQITIINKEGKKRICKETKVRSGNVILLMSLCLFFSYRLQAQELQVLK